MKRKYLSAILSAVMMLSALPQLSLPAAAAKTKLLGDVNADGGVTVSDGVLLSRYVAKWDDITLDKDAADIDRSGEIDTADDNNDKGNNNGHRYNNYHNENDNYNLRYGNNDKGNNINRRNYNNYRYNKPFRSARINQRRL